MLLLACCIEQGLRLHQTCLEHLCISDLLPSMAGCAKVLFLPFALCARDTHAGDDGGQAPGLVAAGPNETYEQLQHPEVSNSRAVLPDQPGLHTVDDAVLSAILLQIALSDDENGFAQLLRLKARMLALACIHADPQTRMHLLSIPCESRRP